MAFYPIEEQITNFVPLNQESASKEQITNFVPLNQESASKEKIKNFTPILGKVEEASARTVEGVAGEALSIADLIVSTPQFITATGTTVLNAAKQLPDRFTKGIPVDWNRAREVGQSVAEPLGIPSKGLNMLYDLTRDSELDLAKAKEESVVNKFMTGLSTGIKKGAVAVEKKTGIPQAASETFADTLMVLGVPGVPIIKNSIKKVLTRPTSKDIAEFQNVTRVKLGYDKPNKIKELNDILLNKVDTPTIIPKNVTDHKSFQEGLIELQGRSAADTSVALLLDKELKDVAPRTQNKFRQELEKEPMEAGYFQTEMTKLENRADYLAKDLVDARAKIKTGEIPFSADGTYILNPKTLVRQIKETKQKIVDLSKEPKKYVELNPGESFIFNLVPYKQVQRSKELVQGLIKKGRVPDIPFSESFAPRRKLPNESGGFFETLFKDTSNINEGYATPDAVEGRTLFVLENKYGSRKVVTESNGNLIQMYKNKIIPMGKVPVDGLKPGTKIGSSVVKEATQAEISKHTKKDFTKNTTMATTDSLVQTRELFRNTEYIENLKETDYFKENAIELKPNESVPAGYKVVDNINNRTPELRNYAFKPDTAFLLEDFNRVAPPTALTKGSDLIVKAMMILPFKHMYNELYHWFTTRGASKLVTPKAYLDLMATMSEAFSEVVTQGPKYQQLLREGGALMSDRTRNLPAMEEAFRRGTVDLSKRKDFKEIAKATGRNPAELINAVSRLSNKAMWLSRDILYMQLALEKGYNAKPKEYVGIKEAARNVERHMPPYRLPTKILGSRGLQKILNNKNFIIFARYKHGMLSSGLNTIKDIAMLDKDVPKSKQFKEGVDSAIATAIALSIIYPVLDDVYTRVFDKIAEVRRPGFAHFLSTVGKVATAEKDPFAVFSVVATLNPILQMFIETAIGYELYNRQPIYNFNDSAKVIWADYRKYLKKKIPMLSDMTKANEDDGGGFSEFAANMVLDVKTKSPKEIREAEERAKIRETTSRRKEREYNDDD